MSELQVRYEPDDEWLGKILVNVRTDDFAGFGEAWIAVEQIIDFAVALERYPLPQNEPCILEGGHGGSVNGAVKPQVLVSLTVKPQGSRGGILVVAKLETEIDSWGRDEALFQAVEARFLTDYSSLARFAAALKALPSESRDAVLAGAVS
jgi:hypothetical protein